MTWIKWEGKKLKKEKRFNRPCTGQAGQAKERERIKGKQKV
jgi:hypothetical protein